jgi:acid phosphatase
MENKSYPQPLSAPYTKSLVRSFASLDNYHAVAHPSLPNYLALTSGSTWGIKDDSYHRLPPQDLGHQLTAAGISWRAYMESMGSDCFKNVDQYAVKHNPFAYYGGGCPANVVGLDRLSPDLAGNAPNFVWITPNLCNDTHDCSLEIGDRWLSRTVPVITASPAWRDGGVLFILWDESEGGQQNHVPGLVVAANLSWHSSPAPFDHYSVLATVEDAFHLPRLGKAASAPTIPFKAA